MFWRVFDCFFHTYHLWTYHLRGKGEFRERGGRFIHSITTINYDVQLPWLNGMGVDAMGSAMVEVAGSRRQGTVVSISQGRRYCCSGCLRRQKPGLVVHSPRQWYLGITGFEIGGFEIGGFLVKPEKMQADSPGEDAIALELSHPKPQPGCPSGLFSASGQCSEKSAFARGWPCRAGLIR